ncbi:MAG: AAA family ATPase [Planctomycetes bacterium]|nr:AAA family ATPase [Planctomycetota bacterium]
MSVPVIAFFNNKGGVGKTSMVYHLSWMFADRGLRIVAADIDPQCNLSAAFLDEERLLQVNPPGGDHALTIFGSVQPLRRGTGDIADPHVEIISDRLGLIVGDMSLSTFEDQLSEVWPKCMDRDERAFRTTSSFFRLTQNAALKHGADAILIDIGPNLGAINRAALIASDFVVIPLGPDLFSIQGLTNLGPALRSWRVEWKDRLVRNPAKEIQLPAGNIEPIGYVVLRHTIRLDRPVKAFDRWIARMPSTYSESVLNEGAKSELTVEKDINCLARIKDYRSLIPLAQEARKPMFSLRAGDGALGAHLNYVEEARKDFFNLAVKIAKNANLKELS